MIEKYNLGDIFKVTEPDRYYQVIEMNYYKIVVQYIGPYNTETITSINMVNRKESHHITPSRSEVILFTSPVLNFIKN